jgi:hypothetical protein
VFWVETIVSCPGIKVFCAKTIVFHSQTYFQNQVGTDVADCFSCLI